MARRYYEDFYGRNRRLRRPALGDVPLRVYEAGLRRSHQIAEEVLHELRAHTPLRKAEYTSEETGKVTKESTPGGTLRDSWRVRDTPAGAAIVTKVRYWMFVEYGTAEHGSAQRPVRNAIENVRARHRSARTR